MATIENYVRPKRLYRYRSLEHIDRELNAIEESYLYCSPYIKLNDPMEGRYFSTKRLKSSTKYREIHDEIYSIKARVRICAFSEVYNNELMWAHYANEFGGICIAYDLFDLLTWLPREASFVRIYYNEKPPGVGLTKRPRDELAKMVLSYKNYRWLYEREWRMFATQDKVFYRDPSCVTRVYIGSRIDSGRRDVIEHRLKALKIPSSRMDLRGYSMAFKPNPK